MLGLVPPMKKIYIDKADLHFVTYGTPWVVQTLISLDVLSARHLTLHLS